MDPASASERRPSARWVWAAKVVIWLLLAWGIGRTVPQAVAQLGQQQLVLDAGWLAAAAVLYLVGTLPCCLYWQQILWAMGQQPRLWETLRAYYIGHLGKYVPGKALVVVLRAALVKSPRTESRVAAVSVFPETLTMMSVGACLAASYLLFVPRAPAGLMLLAVALMVAAGLPTVPFLFRWLVGWLPERWFDHDARCGLNRLTWRLLLGGWLGVAAGWSLLGLSLGFTLWGMQQVNIDLVKDLPLLTAATALAMVAGFLSGIPGGLAVREWVLTEMLAPHLQGGAPIALAAAVLLRLEWLVAELVLSAILYPLPGPSDAPAPARAAPPPKTARPHE